MDWTSLAGLLADRSGKPLALLDRTGRVALFSGAMEQLLGWRRYEVTGRGWADTCVAPEMAVPTRRWLKQALRGALKQYECPVVTRDGHRLLLLLDMALVGGGRDQGLLLTVERVSAGEPSITHEKGFESDYQIVSTPTEFGRVRVARVGCSLRVIEDPSKPCFQALFGHETACADCPVLRPATEAWPRMTVRRRNDDSGDFEIITAERLDPTNVYVKVRRIAPAALNAIHQSRIDGLCHRARLTERERDVLTCLLRGQPTDDIATQLSLSARTVKFHIGNILQKLGADSRADLIRLVGY